MGTVAGTVVGAAAGTVGTVGDSGGSTGVCTEESAVVRTVSATGMTSHPTHRFSFIVRLLCRRRSGRRASRQRAASRPRWATMAPCRINGVCVQIVASVLCTVDAGTVHRHCGSRCAVATQPLLSRCAFARSTVHSDCTLTAQSMHICMHSLYRPYSLYRVVSMQIYLYTCSWIGPTEKN